jgi:hypothetical protein
MLVEYGKVALDHITQRDAVRHIANFFTVESLCSSDIPPQATGGDGVSFIGWLDGTQSLAALLQTQRVLPADETG